MPDWKCPECGDTLVTWEPAAPTCDGCDIKMRRDSRYSRPRDSQRSKVYDTERRALYKFNADLRQEMSLEEVTDYIHKVRHSRWWKSLFGAPRISFTVKSGRGAWGASWGVSLPHWARIPLYTLHELAHGVMYIKEGSETTSLRNEPAHGRMFCRTFLWLVERWMGHEAWKILKQEFKRGGVCYSKPRKVTSMHPNSLANLQPIAARSKDSD